MLSCLLSSLCVPEFIWNIVNVWCEPLVYKRGFREGWLWGSPTMGVGLAPHSLKENSAAGAFPAAHVGILMHLWGSCALIFL